MPKFAKSPPELVEAFGRMLERFPDVERKQMFGYPAAFVNGNMATGLFGAGWMIRLPETDAADFLGIEGAAPFEPMPGRRMGGFYSVPASISGDPDALEPWVRRSVAHAASMPPKQPKPRKARPGR